MSSSGVLKRPAADGATTDHAAGPVLKKPAAWTKWADNEAPDKEEATTDDDAPDNEAPDTDPITSDQRHVLYKKASTKLPGTPEAPTTQMLATWNDADEAGPKAKAAVTNAVVPKTVTCGVSPTLITSRSKSNNLSNIRMSVYLLCIGHALGTCT